jgi:transcriptional regulator with XRE-family HTH domain
MRPTSTAKSPAASDVAIGRNVRLQRLACGLSQGDLARTLGVSYQQVQKYECGINRIGGGRLARIAEVLDAPLATLFAGVAAVEQGHPASYLHLIADPQSLRLAQAFARVQDKDARRLIVALVEVMGPQAGSADLD